MIKNDSIEIKSKINTGCASDYCVAECFGYNFYFGYEETSCHKHKNQDECQNEDCNDSVWNFVAKKDGEEIYRSEAEKCDDDFTFQPLLVGILEMVEKGLFK